MNNIEKVLNDLKKNGSSCVHDIHKRTKLPYIKLQTALTRLKNKKNKLTIVKVGSCPELSRPHNFYEIGVKQETKKPKQKKRGYTKTNGILKADNFKLIVCPNCNEKLLIKREVK